MSKHDPFDSLRVYSGYDNEKIAKDKVLLDTKDVQVESKVNFKN